MRVRDLPDEPGLPDARLADDATTWPWPARPLERLAELLQLGVAPDEAGQPAGGGRLEPRPRGAGPDQLVDLDGVARPLTGTGPRGLTST